MEVYPRYSDATNEAIAMDHLTHTYPVDFVKAIMGLLDPGEIRILNKNWEKLQADLRGHAEMYQYNPSAVTVPVFLLHFHNYV